MNFSRYKSEWGKVWNSRHDTLHFMALLMELSLNQPAASNNFMQILSPENFDINHYMRYEPSRLPTFFFTNLTPSGKEENIEKVI